MKKVSATKVSLNTFTTDVLLCGEQLRRHLHQQNVIKDRQHRGTFYRRSFVACEAVDVLIVSGDLPGRDRTCLSPMQILLKHDIIHNIEMKTEYKDEFRDVYALYSFRLDDDTFVWTEEAQIVLASAALFSRLCTSSDYILKDHMVNHMTKTSFRGFDLVNWLVKHDPGIQDRSVALTFCQDLLDWEVLENVLYPNQEVFVDDVKSVYAFRLDVQRKRSLTGLLIYKRLKGSTASASTDYASTASASTASASTDSLGSHSAGASARPIPAISGSPANRKVSTGSAASLNDSSLFGTSPSVTTTESESSSVTDGEILSNMPSVVLRHVTVEEIEDEESPYVKKRVMMRRDEVGYGFVVRGASPCYVQVIDPNSPAAQSGLEIRQYVASVNGLNVLRMGSKELSTIIADTHSQSDWLKLTVYSNLRRTAALDESSSASADDSTVKPN